MSTRPCQVRLILISLSLITIIWWTSTTMYSMNGFASYENQIYSQTWAHQQRMRVMIFLDQNLFGFRGSCQFCIVLATRRSYLKSSILTPKKRHLSITVYHINIMGRRELGHGQRDFTIFDDKFEARFWGI